MTATLHTDGADIFFEDGGEGPCVMLSHSFLCSGAMWGPQLPALRRSYRVVNVDLRGHGQSGPVRGPVTLDDLLSDLVAVLDHLGVEKAVWGGLSVGGMIALRAALDVPDRVRALILADTHAGAERRSRVLEYRAMAAGIRLLGFGPFLPALARKMFGRTTRRERPDLVAEWKRRFAALDVPSLERFLGALTGRDSVVDRLDRIRVPTLILVGEEDVSLPPARSREIHEGIRGSKLVTIPGAGHLSALEQPERVTAAMVAFLERL